jgi:Zn-dependent protease with chaperone function
MQLNQIVELESKKVNRTLVSSDNLSANRHIAGMLVEWVVSPTFVVICGVSMLTDQGPQTKHNGSCGFIARRPHQLSALPSSNLGNEYFTPLHHAAENRANPPHDELASQAVTAGGADRRYAYAITGLQVRIVVGAVALLSAHAWAVSVILPQVILAAPILVLSATIAASAFWLQDRPVPAGRGEAQSILNQLFKTQPDLAAHERVVKSLERLSAKLEKRLDFDVRTEEGDPHFAFLTDRLFQKDVLGMDSRGVHKLSDAELDAIVAHEISHSNRTFSKFRRLHGLLNYVSVPAVFCGTTLSMLGSRIAGSTLPQDSEAALVVATVASAVAACSLWLGWMYISRANETKTDLRAVRLTNDPGAYISALEKVREYGLSSRDMRKPEKESMLSSILRTHPTFEARTATVRKVFG